MTISHGSVIIAGLLLAAALLLTLVKAASTPQLIVSDNAGDRLTPKPSASWTPSPWAVGSQCPSQSACLTSTLAQEIDGFGGSFQRAGATVLALLSNDTQSSLMTVLFDPVLGAGFTLGKVPIGATDFGVPTWYTYEDTPGEFSIAHDLTGDGAVIPFVLQAMKYMEKDTPLWLQATMDYPPDYMMNTTTPLPHPILNSTTFPQLAQYYLSYAEAFANATGTPLKYLSMFNEPYSSYVTPTSDQIIELLVNHVGPLFRGTPGAPKLTWGEQYGRMKTLETGPYIMNAPGVQNFTDILFYHGYDCGDGGDWHCYGEDHLNTTCPGLDIAMSNITEYKQLYPDLKMWMTEVCYAIEFEDYPPNVSICPALPRTDFEDGLQWGRMLFGDMTSGASGWIYWNLILNTSGGPYLFSPDHNDPWDNIQHPVVIAHPETDNFTLTGCYFFMAHFSRYVRRGMKRVVVDRSPDLSVNIYVAAFVNESSGQYVVEFMNDNVNATTASLTIAGSSLSVELPGISIVTVLFSSSASNESTTTSAPTGIPPATFQPLPTTSAPAIRQNTTIVFQCDVGVTAEELIQTIRSTVPGAEDVVIYVLTKNYMYQRHVSSRMMKLLTALGETQAITLVFEDAPTIATDAVALANDGKLAGVTSASIVIENPPGPSSVDRTQNIIIGASVGGGVVLIFLIVFLVKRNGAGTNGEADYVAMNARTGDI